MATLTSKMAFINVDFPTLGRPTRATNPEDNAFDSPESDMCGSFGCHRGWTVWFWAVLLLVAVTLGCEDSRAAETELFEAAEVDYQNGNYSDALSGYQEFLNRYPQSPLAPIVETRLRNIHREVSSVMGSSDSPRPSYHGLNAEQSPQPPSDAAQLPNSAPLVPVDP